MAEILKDRSELDPQFQWDLTPMFESDAAWETALESLDADIESLSAFAGKLSDAVTIGAYLDASTEVSRKVERLYCYASCMPASAANMSRWSRRCPSPSPRS